MSEDNKYSAAAAALYDLFENWVDDFSYSYEGRIKEDIELILRVYFRDENT